jgi:hypothetical protein
VNELLRTWFNFARAQTTASPCPSTYVGRYTPAVERCTHMYVHMWSTSFFSPPAKLQARSNQGPMLWLKEVFFRNLFHSTQYELSCKEQHCNVCTKSQKPYKTRFESTILCSVGGDDDHYIDHSASAMLGFFKIFSPKKWRKNLAILTQIMYSYLARRNEHNIGFQEKSFSNFPPKIDICNNDHNIGYQ